MQAVQQPFELGHRQLGHPGGRTGRFGAEHVEHLLGSAHHDRSIQGRLGRRQQTHGHTRQGGVQPGGVDQQPQHQTERHEDRGEHDAADPQRETRRRASATRSMPI
jgi:hypothetical protein